MFPFNGLLPSHVVGAISAARACSGAHRPLRLSPRRILALDLRRKALLALYLNVFVGVAQAFQKLAFLQALAPTQSEPPFVVAQLVVLAIFLWLGFLAVRRFHPKSALA